MKSSPTSTTPPSPHRAQSELREFSIVLPVRWVTRSLRLIYQSLFLTSSKAVHKLIAVVMFDKLRIRSVVRGLRFLEQLQSQQNVCKRNKYNVSEVNLCEIYNFLHINID